MSTYEYVAENSPYARFLKKKTESELQELSYIKRLLECYSGDEEIRGLLDSGKLSLKQFARNRGCELDDIESLRPIIDPNFAHFRQDATEETWPLTAKWNEYFNNTIQSLSYYLNLGDSNGQFKEFDNWRKKQILRTFMDVGSSSAFLVHPPVAFELSDGCSVGCWFCGISAKKFGGHFEADEQGLNEWKNILESVKKVIGRGMTTGFCYWATEPLDHPDYDKFISIYKEVVGITPQTTTAIAMKDTKLTRRVLDMWEEDKYVPNRFSVLSQSAMKKIHAEFTPKELLGVELVMQGKGSNMPKSSAGKALDTTGRRLEKEEMQSGTIACVTGFLVNLPNKTIRLVSPTIASKEHPEGYYVFAEESFSTADQLETIMRKMILNEAAREPNGNEVISLNPNYWVEEVGSQNSIRDSKFGMGMDILNVMAPMLKSGKYTPNEIVKQTIKENYDPLLSIKVMQELMVYGMAGDFLRPL